jgi:hypothetical protein
LEAWKSRHLGRLAARVDLGLIAAIALLLTGGVSARYSHELYTFFAPTPVAARAVVAARPPPGNVSTGVEATVPHTTTFQPRFKPETRFSDSSLPTPQAPDLATRLLHGMVARDAPELLEAADDWTRVNVLRAWASRNIDWCSTSLLLDHDLEFQLYTRSAPELFTAFFEDRGGVWCGGTAYALMRLYQSFGYEAWTLDVGSPDVMTHVVTLVTIMHEGAPKRVVQDATFNISYSNDHGDPLDYLEIVALLNRGEDALVHPRGGGGAQRDFLLDPHDLATLSTLSHLVDTERAPELSRGEISKYMADTRWAVFERKYASQLQTLLAPDARPARMVYLLLYPLSGSDPKMVRAINELGMK